MSRLPHGIDPDVIAARYLSPGDNHRQACELLAALGIEDALNWYARWLINKIDNQLRQWQTLLLRGLQPCILISEYDWDGLRGASRSDAELPHIWDSFNPYETHQHFLGARVVRSRDIPRGAPLVVVAKA